MSPHEPVELLEVTGLPDQQVFGDRIEVADTLDRRTNAGNHPGIDDVQRTEVFRRVARPTE